MTPYPTIIPVPTQIPFDADTAKIVGGIFAGSLMIFFVGFSFWIVALIDILKSEFKDPINKVIWLILTLILPFLGPLLYFIIGRKQVKVKSGIKLKVVFTVISLIVWYPVGVILMWFWTKWPMWVKVLLTAILALFVVAKFFVK